MINADLSLTAERCRTDAPKLIHLLRGDLDWIVMKALEKDRTRRFETASGLARDIQRHLHNEPVEARPPGGFYRFSKLVRRNKLAFAAGAAVMAALVLGLGLSTALFLRERQARHRADEAEKIQAGLRQQAEERSEIGQKIGLSALYLTQWKYEESEMEINPIPLAVLTNHVTTAFLFNAFADGHARHGEWAAAISNFSKVIAIVPSDFPAYASHAMLLAQTGDQVAWRRDGALMLGQFAGTSDPVIATRIAQACLILPPPNAELEDAGKMVEIALAADSPHKTRSDVQLLKALAEYRLGHFGGAVEWLQKVAPEKGNWNQKVEIQTLLAMSQHRLGRMAEARATLADALQTADRTLDKLGEDLGSHWSDWVMAHLLMDEARALIKEPASQK